MEVRPINTDEKEHYAGLVARVGRVFDSPKWSDLFGDHVVQYGFFNGGGDLLGGFQLCRERRFGLRVLRNPPFTPSIGPFLESTASNPSVLSTQRRAAIELVRQTVESDSAAVVLLTLDRQWEDALPFIWNGFRVTTVYTYLLGLDRPVENLWAGLSKSRRNDIRKTESDGLEVVDATDLSVVRRLVKLTFQRQGARSYDRELCSILEDFSDARNSFAFIAEREGRPIASAFCVHDQRTAYYLLGGYDPDYRHHGAGAACVWNCIRRAHELGLKTFDFEGSSIPSIERFFRGFGGVLTPLRSVSRAWMPLSIAARALGRMDL